MSRFIVASIILLGICSSCSNEPNHISTSITVSGLVLNSEAQSIRLLQDWEPVAVDTIDDQGHFTFHVHPTSSAFYVIEAGESQYNLFLAPGDSTYLSINATDAESGFIASGSKAEETMYLYEKQQLSDQLGLNDYPGIWLQSKETFLTVKDSMLTSLKRAYSSLRAKPNVDKEFLTSEDAYYEYQDLLMEYMYPLYHGYFTQQSKDSIGYPSADTEAKVAAVKADDKALLVVEPYKQLLEFKIQTWVYDKMEQDSSLKAQPGAYTDLAYMAPDSLFGSHEIRSYFRFNMVKDELEYRGPAGSQKMYDSYMTTYKDDTLYIKQLDKAMAKWEPISPGKQVPDFAFTTVSGEDVKLSDLRGQLIYIDIWATWCGPCIAEHPAWDKLKAEYAGKPVAFVTVSIDNTRAPWEKMVADKKMEGHQWYADNAWRSDLAQHFMVNAIPRFLLIDAGGKVIDPSADRPSGSIRKVLDEQLEGLLALGS